MRKSVIYSVLCLSVAVIICLLIVYMNMVTTIINPTDDAYTYEKYKITQEIVEKMEPIALAAEKEKDPARKALLEKQADDLRKERLKRLSDLAKKYNKKPSEDFQDMWHPTNKN